MTSPHYIILTGKPGIFHTEISTDTTAVERYDYVFHGRTRATFVIATLERETRVALVDDGEPSLVNRVPSKLFRKYASLAEARRDLEQLVHAQLPGARLLRVDPVTRPCC